MGDVIGEYGYDYIMNNTYSQSKLFSINLEQLLEDNPEHIFDSGANFF